MFRAGQTVEFQQIEHVIPLGCSKLTIPVHEEAVSGQGKIQVALKQQDGWRLFVLPKGAEKKTEKHCLFLRVPPDIVKVVGT